MSAPEYNQLITLPTNRAPNARGLLLWDGPQGQRGVPERSGREPGACLGPTFRPGFRPAVPERKRPEGTGTPAPPTPPGLWTTSLAPAGLASHAWRGPARGQRPRGDLQPRGPAPAPVLPLTSRPFPGPFAFPGPLPPPSLPLRPVPENFCPAPSPNPGLPSPARAPRGRGGSPTALGTPQGGEEGREEGVRRGGCWGAPAGISPGGRGVDS